MRSTFKLATSVSELGTRDPSCCSSVTTVLASGSAESKLMEASPPSGRWIGLPSWCNSFDGLYTRRYPTHVRIVLNIRNAQSENRIGWSISHLDVDDLLDEEI